MQKLIELNVYSNKSFIRFENHLNVYENVNGQRFLNLLKSFNVEAPYIFNPKLEEIHLVSPADNFYNISYTYYNTIDLWWFICSYNKIQDPTKRPEPGRELRILKLEYIMQVLNDLVGN